MDSEWLETNIGIKYQSCVEVC